MEMTPCPVFKSKQNAITQLQHITFKVLRPQSVFACKLDCLQEFMQVATGYVTTELRAYELELTADKFIHKVNVYRKAVHDMIDRVSGYQRDMKKYDVYRAFYKQCIQLLTQVSEDIERYWSRECEIDYVLTNVQLGQQKPLLRRRWNTIKQYLQDADVSQQLVLLIGQPVMNLLLSNGERRVKKSAVTYLLDLLDAIEALACSGKMNTGALAWLLATHNFNSRDFVEYCFGLLEKELCSRETLNSQLDVLIWLQQQTVYLDLFSPAALMPAKSSVRQLVEVWLAAKALEYASRVTVNELERWHVLAGAGVLTLLCHVMLNTNFLEGNFAQSLRIISRTCRLIKAAAPTVAYLEKEFYARKGIARKELLRWMYIWIAYLEAM